MIPNKVKISVVFDRKHVATRHDASDPHPGLIQLKVLHNKKNLYIAIASVYADEFGRKVKGRIVGDTVHGRADAEHINAQIASMRKSVIDTIERCNRLQAPFSLDFIDPKKSGRIETSNFLKFIEESSQADDISKGTRSSERNVVVLLRKFGAISDFSDLTTANIMAFDTWLQQKHLHDNPNLPLISTTYRHVVHRVLKKYINRALRLDLISINPYDRFDAPPVKTRPRVFLTEQQVQQIAAFDISDEHIHQNRWNRNVLQVRDLFLVQCFTGMAFIDIMTVDWPSTRITNTITTGRQKTGVQYSVKFLPPVIKILEKYDYHLPKIKYTTYTKALHSIQQSLGLNVNLTSHVGRHTFATTFGLRCGVPIELLSKMLGHTNIATTQIYAKILPDQVLDAFNKIKIPELIYYTPEHV